MSTQKTQCCVMFPQIATKNAILLTEWQGLGKYLHAGLAWRGADSKSTGALCNIFRRHMAGRRVSAAPNILSCSVWAPSSVYLIRRPPSDSPTPAVAMVGAVGAAMPCLWGCVDSFQEIHSHAGTQECLLIVHLQIIGSGRCQQWRALVQLPKKRLPVGCGTHTHMSSGPEWEKARL